MRKSNLRRFLNNLRTEKTNRRKVKKQREYQTKSLAKTPVFVAFGSHCAKFAAIESQNAV